VTYQIIYSSEAATPMQTDDLQELLDHARRSNAASGITGALVYAEGIFLQILEGDKGLLQDLMAKIRRDVRHESVFVLREGEVPAAIFGSWKMAFVSATPKQVAKWAGIGAANDTTESVSETAEEQNRTAQFAQDILSLLVADDTTQGKVE
jgi:Sensors of blue-light using FAD